MANEFDLNGLIGGKVLPVSSYPKVKEPSINKVAAYNGDVRDYSTEGDTKYFTSFATKQVVPLRFKLKTESAYWLFPIEPMISVDSKNIIAKRNVAKKRDGGGSIKEYWTQDDWQVNINGIFSDTAWGLNWPLDDVKELLKYCTAKEPIEVACTPLLELGITHIVIEEYELPFTKGQENQNFTIKAVSDKSWDLFIKR